MINRYRILYRYDPTTLPFPIIPILSHTMSRLKETSIDAFILRIYREQNRIGFVKAVTEEPEYIQNGSSLLLVGDISSSSLSSSCYRFYSIIIMITTIITMIKHHNRHLHHHLHHHHLFSFIYCRLW